MSDSKYGKVLSSAQLLVRLDRGGWVVSGGYDVRDLEAPNLPVIEASFNGVTLRVKTPDREFTVSTSQIVLANPWTVEICRTYMRREQHKKAEGGGLREVPYVGVALKITHACLMAAYASVSTEKARAREVYRQGLHDRLNAEFAGKKFLGTELTVDASGESKLALRFEDGLKLSVPAGFGTVASVSDPK